MRIRDGTNILVATVGRLLDFIEKGVINTSKIQFVILDEADRMLDMGKHLKKSRFHKYKKTFRFPDFNRAYLSYGSQ